jgi:2-oxo-3-hexenedioate decarboxylase
VASDEELQAKADELIEAYDAATNLTPITDTAPDFDTIDAYEVLRRIAARRVAEGWVLAGRKIGFTNRTIWPFFGVDKPMWAHMWDRTVIAADSHPGPLSVARFVQPRIEPEVVFKLSGPVPVTDDPVEVLGSVEWMAAGFEIVQCHFPDWRFSLADCTAAFGLHGALVLGKPVAITDANRASVAAALPTFEATLTSNGEVVDRGVGANVLDSPALALAHLAAVLAEQPEHPPLAAGELVTTGTITNAWPIAPGERWESAYGTLGLEGLTLTLC